jgi:uncharacterized protein (DUF2141 family)
MKIAFMILIPYMIFTYDLFVQIDGVKSKKGNIRIGLYVDHNNFTSDQVYYKATSINIENIKTTYTFHNLPKGIYAVSIYHDENQNNTLDTNLFGIPQEGYGFSMNPKVTFATPTFDESSFKLNSNKTIVINMKY